MSALAPTLTVRAATSETRVLRLLLITDTAIAQTGGSERFLRNLLGGLDPVRFQIDVVQLSPASPGGEALPIRERGLLQYRPIDAIYGLRAWLVYCELRARMLNGEYDLVQSQHEKSDLLCALLPRGPNRAIRISNRRDSGFQKSSRLRLGFRALNHRFDWVVAPSSALLTQLGADEGVDIAHTRCLPNGVDTLRFQPISAERRRAGRLQLGIAEDAFVFGCVARMVPLKRHEDLIAAFAIIAEQHPDAILLLIGGGPLLTALRAQIANAGLHSRVHLLGERSDIDALLPLLDGALSCSETEGMSNAILEAMACALPVIATAVGGSPELVADGETGVLVAARAPLQIAAAMRCLLSDRQRARRWGQQARERAECSFSLAAMVARYAQFYRLCAERR